MKQHIWIASHFHNQTRYTLFIETMKSITSQTVKPDMVVISYSKQFNVRTNVAEMFHTFLNPLNIPFKIYEHKERLYQFEHIQYIHKNFKNDNNIFVTFCDDDDILLPDCVESLLNAINKHNITADSDAKIKYNYLPVSENSTFDDHILMPKLDSKNCRDALGCCSCTLRHLNLFLNSMAFSNNDVLMDIYFLEFVSITPPTFIFLISKPLFCHRIYEYNHGMKIWLYRKVDTESQEYIDFVTYLDKYFEKYENKKDVIQSIYLKTDPKKHNFKTISNLKNYISNLWITAHGKELSPKEFLKNVLKRVKITNIRKLPLSDCENSSLSSEDEVENKIKVI